MVWTNISLFAGMFGVAYIYKRRSDQESLIEHFEHDVDKVGGGELYRVWNAFSILDRAFEPKNRFLNVLFGVPYPSTVTNAFYVALPHYINNKKDGTEFRPGHIMPSDYARNLHAIAEARDDVMVKATLFVGKDPSADIGHPKSRIVADELEAFSHEFPENQLYNELVHTLLVRFGRADEE